MVPCELPLIWTVTRVDPEFGISEADATRAVRAAGELWETALGRPLFTHGADGFPIRLVYDDRQRAAQERVARMEALDRRASELEEERGALVARDAERARVAEALRADLDDYQRRSAAHNAAVRAWNERGGAPADVAAELAEAGERLRDQQRALDRRREALEERGGELEADGTRLNERLRGLARDRDSLDRERPAGAVQAGEYRERVLDLGSPGQTVRREIRLYRFDGTDELRIVAAHELGHALGLGHVDDPLAIMSPEHRSGDGPVRVTRAERDRLRELCDGLAG